MGIFYASVLLFDGNLNIFRLWTKQEIRGHHLGLWGTLINMFLHFVIFYRHKKLINGENN